MTEKYIILGIREENLIAYKQLLKQHRIAIRKFIAKMGVTDDCNISELESNVILACINSFKKPDFHLTCKLNTFIYSICKNQVRKFFESPFNARKSSMMNAENLGYYPRYDFEIDYNTFLFREAVKELSEKDQKIMNLLVEGYSTKEIIELSDLRNKDSVKTKKYKLIKKVREILGVKKPTKKVSS